MPFVWEEILNAITELPSDMRWVESEEFLQRWIMGVANKMHEEEVGIKKIMDIEITDRELAGIFENSGYIMCETCRKVVEDDHKCRV